MKKLERRQMKSIKGGLEEGNQTYNCCLTYTDTTTEAVNGVCASSLQQARVICRGQHTNVADSECTLVLQ